MQISRAMICRGFDDQLRCAPIRQVSVLLAYLIRERSGKLGTKMCNDWFVVTIYDARDVVQSNRLNLEIGGPWRGEEAVR